ncbi:MAG: hypothetical protein DRN05_04375 [Thermoplasmata archaeon]|nr:MAG: hypothetical protein DRN05_04375 [Thermoplasmata archaeon]
MPGRKEIKFEGDAGLTYEGIVMDRFFKAFYAKDTDNETLFDSIMDEIEMLFKLVPELYNSYKSEKQKLDEYLAKALDKVAEDVSSINDEILKKAYKNHKEYEILWDYRSDLLEMMLNKFNDYGLLPYAKIHMKAEVVTEEPYIETTQDTSTKKEKKKTTKGKKEKTQEEEEEVVEATPVEDDIPPSESIEPVEIPVDEIDDDIVEK